MANNITKYIDVTGNKMGLKVIELACQIAYDKGKDNEEMRCMGLANAMSLMGCDKGTVTRHGWAEIVSISVESESHGDEEDKVSIGVLTPYGNLSEVMEELREKFPLCWFHCFNEVDEENDFD